MSRMLAVCCLSLGVLAPSAGATSRAAMLEALSAVRAHHGLGPLREAPVLDATATAQSRRVLRDDRFAHPRRLRAPGFAGVGEAMALMRGWSARPRPAVRLWLRSPQHRALLLDPRFAYAGVGWARGRFGRRLASVWVVRFAARGPR